MNTFTPPIKRDVPEDARRSIARELSRYYHELSAPEEPAAPPFSLAGLLRQMSTPDGLHVGRENEVCRGAAVIAGEHFDPHKVRIPLAALQGRDLTAAAAAGGGYLKGTDVASPFDVLRPWSVVVDGGITVIPDLVGDVGLPRVTASTTAGAVPTESTTFTSAQPTVGQATLTPKTLSTTLVFSRQWKMQSGPKGELLLRQQLLGAVGTLLDQLFFAGTGASGQPTGLLATAGVNTTSGTSLAHAGILAMRRQVLAAGGREAGLSWVGTPAVQEALGARERATGGGRFLWDGATILDKPATATANAPTGMLAVGDFSQAVLGVFGPASMLLEIDPYTFFQSGRLTARVVVSADFGFPNPAAFSVAATVT